MRTPKTYLLAFLSPDLQPEHARLLEAVKHHSDGDFVEVSKQAASSGRGLPTTFSILYLFTSSSFPSEMGFPSLNGDKYFLAELAPGLGHWHEGLSVAHNWLERHKPTQDF